MVQPSAATIYLATEINNDIGTGSTGESTITTQVTKRENLSSSLNDATPSSLESVNIIINADDIPSLFDPLSLAGLIPALRPESTVNVTVTPTPAKSTPDLTVVNTSFLLAGLHPASERREDDGTRVLVARRKGLVSSYSSSAKISLVVPGGDDASSEEKKVVDGDAGMGGGDGKVVIELDDCDDEDDLIDEDGLLEAGGDDFLVPASTSGADRSSNGDDCGGRKACDNCTCGRAEKEAGVESSSVPKQAPKSDCGKCGMGDAFRCASCPYLGKPAFKPGEEHLVLDLDDDINF